MRAFSVIHQAEDGSTSTIYSGVDGVAALKTYRDCSQPGKTFLFDSLHAKNKRNRVAVVEIEEPAKRRGRPPKFATV